MPPEIVLRSILSTAFIVAMIRVTTPLVLPAMGGLIADLSGVGNVALEGMMLTASFVGVVGSAFSHNVWVGCLAGVSAAVLMALILAYFHIELGANNVLTGLALNILASGGTVFLLYQLTHDKAVSSKLPSLTVPRVHIPILRSIPVLGQVLSGYNLITYVAFALVILTWLMLNRTPLGVRIRACGENAAAAAAVGINVRQIRYIALILSGIASGLGGINLSMGYLTMFQRDMVAGRGFIALAAISLGNRKPLGVALAALLFGCADALASQLGSLNIPSQLVQMIPYAATVFALAIYAVRTRAAANERQRRYSEKAQALAVAEAGGKASGSSQA